MLWLLLFKETRSRIRIGVFMVEKQISGRTEEQPNENPTNMLYRITWSDFEGRSRTLSRARSVVWSSALKDCRRKGITASGKVDPFTMIRSRPGRLEIRWYYQSNRRIRLPTPAPSSAATVVTTIPIEVVTHPDDGWPAILARVYFISLGFFLKKKLVATTTYCETVIITIYHD